MTLREKHAQALQHLQELKTEFERTVGRIATLEELISDAEPGEDAEPSEGQ